MGDQRTQRCVGASICAARKARATAPLRAVDARSASLEAPSPRADRRRARTPSLRRGIPPTRARPTSSRSIPIRSMGMLPPRDRGPYMPRLVITKGAGLGRDHAIGTECVLGRAPDVDFVVDDLGVSRRHARVYREGDAYVVADLGSRNGTFVNTQRVQAASLNDGDLIRVGGVELVFRQKDIAATPKSPGAAVVVPPTV